MLSLARCGYNAEKSHLQSAAVPNFCKWGHMKWKCQDMKLNNCNLVALEMPNTTFWPKSILVFTFEIYFFSIWRGKTVFYVKITLLTIKSLQGEKIAAKYDMKYMVICCSSHEFIRKIHFYRIIWAWHVHYSRNDTNAAACKRVQILPHFRKGLICCNFMSSKKLVSRSLLHVGNYM